MGGQPRWGARLPVLRGKGGGLPGFIEAGGGEFFGRGTQGKGFSPPAAFGFFRHSCPGRGALAWDNPAAEEEGSPKLSQEAPSGRQSPFHADPAPGRRRCRSVRDLQRPCLDKPVVRGGAELPDTPPARSLENPLEKSASNGCFRGVPVRGRPGRASYRCSLLDARSVGLRRPRLRLLCPSPSPAHSQDLGGHAAVPGAPTASLRRSRAGPAAELGRSGCRRPPQRIFTVVAHVVV